MKLDQEKLPIIYDVMKKNNVDAWLITGRESIMKSEPVLPVLGDKKAMAEQIKIIEGLEARAFVAPLKTALDDSAEVFASNIEKAISKTPIKIEFEDLEGNVKEVDLSGGMLEYYKRAFKNTTQLLEYTDALKNFGKLTYDNEDEGTPAHLEKIGGNEICKFYNTFVATEVFRHEYSAFVGIGRVVK